jgi:hypothetical protein
MECNASGTFWKRESQYPEIERNDNDGRICSHMNFHFRPSVFELVLWVHVARLLEHVSTLIRPQTSTHA